MILFFYIIPSVVEGTEKQKKFRCPVGCRRVNL